MIQLTKEDEQRIEAEALELYPEDLFETTMSCGDNNLSEREAYIAGATSERIKAKEVVQKASNVLLLTEEDGTPVDGFRFREMILELKQALLNYNP